MNIVIFRLYTNGLILNSESLYHTRSIYEYIQVSIYRCYCKKQNIHSMNNSSPAQKSNEQQLIAQYNYLKKELSNCILSQQTSVNQATTLTSQTFNMFSDMVSSLTNRIDILQIQYSQAKQRLQNYEDTSYLKNKYPYYQQMDTNQILQQIYNGDNHEYIHDSLPNGINQNLEVNKNGYNSSIYNGNSKINIKHQYPPMNQTQPIHDYKSNQYKNNDQKPIMMRPTNRIGNYISKYAPLANASTVVQKKQTMDIHKMRIKEQFTVVAEFVHNFLISRLMYEEDHQRFMVPKKLILTLYQNWCKSNNREILLEKRSVIQMSITNQLKIAFPGMDSFTKNYRGLKFINNANNGSQLKHQMIESSIAADRASQDELEDELENIIN